MIKSSFEHDSSYTLAKSIEEALRSLATRTTDQRIIAHLYGLVTRVHERSSRFRFIVITDGTAKIQLVAEKEKFSDAEWTAIRCIKKSNFIEVVGDVKHTKQGRPSIFLTKQPIVSPSLPIDQWPVVTQIGHQILLARVKKVITEYLDAKDFLEISPLFLSTSWHETEIDLLKVLLPGFGAPLYLAPTPATQLLRTIATTSHPKVYAVSKCFTIEHTSEHNSAEGDIVVVKILNNNLNNVVAIAKDIVRLILDRLASFSEVQASLLLENVQEQIVNKIPVKIEEFSSPVIVQTEQAEFEDKLFGKRNVSLFAYYLPFAKVEKGKLLIEQSTPPFIVCDGAEEQFPDNLQLASLTIHIDRLVKLIHNLRYPEVIPDFRTLVDLGIRGR